MRIAAAQIAAVVGDIEGNFNRHLEMIDIAIANQADLIVFPEMSITGYCRKEAKNLVIASTNPIITEFKKISDRNDLMIIAGAPINIEFRLFIGAYILQPNQEPEVYTKQFLHEGESEFYSSSFDYNPIIRFKEESIQFAICADINHPQHPKNAKANNCTLYVPSIFYSQKGIGEGHEILAKYAEKNSLQVLMSNYSGDLWGMKAGGKSAFWDKNGIKILQLSGDEEGLLLLEKMKADWSAKKITKDIPV